MNINRIITACLLLALVLTAGMSISAEEEQEEFHARARAEKKINPAVSNLKDYLSRTSSLPDNIRILITEVLDKTSKLLSEDTKTYDDNWMLYHEKVKAIYRDLKKMKADDNVTRNVKALAEISTVDGFIVTSIGVSTVFAGLILLAAIFSLVPVTLDFGKKKIFSKTHKEISSAPLTGELISAISTALYIHLNVYQEEQKQILTWDRRFRRFSPWNMSGRLSINQKNR